MGSIAVLSLTMICLLSWSSGEKWSQLWLLLLSPEPLTLCQHFCSIEAPEVTPVPGHGLQIPTRTSTLGSKRTGKMQQGPTGLLRRGEKGFFFSLRAREIEKSRGLASELATESTAVKDLALFSSILPNAFMDSQLALK